jgi:uncharacterized protein
MKKMRRRLLGLLLLLGLGYAGICGALLLGQNRLLYIGTHLAPADARPPYPVFTDASGAQIGWVLTPPGEVRGTIVFFHGNDEQAWQSARAYGPYFTSRGWRVVFPEYRGFDFRGGTPTHDNTIAEAVATMRRAAQLYPGPLWVAGNSLGAGIAAQAAKPGGAQRVLLFVPWDSMGAVAQERYPFVPTSLLLRLDGTDYDSCAALAGMGAQVFMTYAGQDVIIPSHHARNLAACLGVPAAQIFPLPDATHLNWYEKLAPAQWDRMLARD